MKKLLIFSIIILTTSTFGQVKHGQKPSDFVPKAYFVFQEIRGDLNKDGLEDIVLIIKGKDKDNIVQHEYRGELDRNRRGIIVLFNKKDHYELVLKNYDCFSSENEDGGIYFAPELFVGINKTNLYIDYNYGRYGYWIYTFRYQNSDFELIGYDVRYGAPVIDSEISINFSTKKKKTKININQNGESGEEIFEETWRNININKLIKLSEIEDFDSLNMNVY